MFGLGMQELLVVMVIVVVVFGASRLPLIGDGMGKMITNFKRSMKDAKQGELDEDKKDDTPEKKAQDA